MREMSSRRSKSFVSLTTFEVESLENELHKLRSSTREALVQLSNQVKELQEYCGVQEKVIAQFEEQVCIIYYDRFKNWIITINYCVLIRSMFN